MTEIDRNRLDVKSEYLYDLLQRIKERPGMYLGKRSITYLHMLLIGYSQARMELGLPRTEQEYIFDNFQAWIQTRFNITSTHGWNDIILFYSTDERDALDNLFKLFEEFRKGESASPSYVCTENSGATPQLTQV